MSFAGEPASIKSDLLRPDCYKITDTAGNPSVRIGVNRSEEKIKLRRKPNEANSVFSCPTSLLAVGGCLLMGKTNTDALLAAVSWLAFIVALAAVFIINAIEDVKNHAADTSAILHKLSARRGGKE